MLPQMPTTDPTSDEQPKEAPARAPMVSGHSESDNCTNNNAAAHLQAQT